MPHQCVRCNTMYPDGAQEILKGCSCGSRLFFYIKKERIEEAKVMTQSFTEEEKQQIEHDVLDLIDEKDNNDAPVVLDFESIRVTGPGKFELDLVHLFKEDEPLIYKLDEGKYVIDIKSTFEKINRKRKQEKGRKK